MNVPSPNYVSYPRRSKSGTSVYSRVLFLRGGPLAEEDSREDHSAGLPVEHPGGMVLGNLKAASILPIPPSPNSLGPVSASVLERLAESMSGKDVTKSSSSSTWKSAITRSPEHRPQTPLIFPNRRMSPFYSRSAGSIARTAPSPVSSFFPPIPPPPPLKLASDTP